MAATLRSGSACAKAELLGTFVRQVRLHENKIETELEDGALHERLGLEVTSITAEPLVVTTPAVRIRRGHQLRLIVPGPELARSKPARRDDKLVALLAEAQQAKQLVLSNSERPLASIARENGRCRTRLGKLVALSCLAPDIVTGIVEGTQPEHLTASRLISKPLPLSWTNQRRELGFA